VGQLQARAKSHIHSNIHLHPAPCFPPPFIFPPCIVWLSFFISWLQARAKSYIHFYIHPLLLL